MDRWGIGRGYAHGVDRVRDVTLEAQALARDIDEALAKRTAKRQGPKGKGKGK